MPPVAIRVFAMARPSRPSAEARAVLAAAEILRRPSVAATAAAIAKRVAEDCVRFVDTDREDELMAVLVELEAHAKPSPIVELSRSAEIDTAALVISARTRRFQARSCRQLSDAEWRRETAVIVAEVAARLATRYRKHLQ